MRPGADAFSALHAAFWTGGTLLYVPKGVKVEAPLFSLVGLARPRAGSTWTTRSSSSRRGPRRPWSARRPARGRGDDAGPARRRRRAVRRARGQAPVRQHPELGRRHLALQPRAGPGRARRRPAVDRRRPRVAAGQGQPGGRPDGPGGPGPGQRRHVHDRPPAPGLLHPPGPPGPSHHAATCCTRGASRTSSRIVWKGMIRVEKDAQKTDAYQKNDNLILSDPPAPTRSPAWRSRPTTSAAPTAPPPAGSTTR